MPTHGRRRLLVLLRIEFFIKRLRSRRQRHWCNIDANQSARGLCQQGPIADRKEAKTKIGKLAVMDCCPRRKTDNGVVAVPPRKLMEEMHRILSRSRQFDSDQQLLR